jgi:hypothetical protein
MTTTTTDKKEHFIKDNNVIKFEKTPIFYKKKENKTLVLMYNKKNYNETNDFNNDDYDFYVVNGNEVTHIKNEDIDKTLDEFKEGSGQESAVTVPANSVTTNLGPAATVVPVVTTDSGPANSGPADSNSGQSPAAGGKKSKRNKRQTKKSRSNRRRTFRQKQMNNGF